MNLSLALRSFLILSTVTFADARVGSRRTKSKSYKRTLYNSRELDVGGEFSDSYAHEVYQYEQIKFEDEPEWDCTDVEVAGQIGCIKCWNPRPAGGEALIVEVEATHKREDFNIKDEEVNPPRKHCIFPERGPFYTCFNSNLVIAPDTSWLDPFKDKPIYNATGGEGDSCYPGDLAAKRNADDSV